MQWNSHVDGFDIVTDAKKWCDIDSSDTTSYPLDDMGRAGNKALDKCHMLILGADGRWEYDDNNNAGTPLINTSTSITSGDTKVAIPLTWLKITRVRITDAAGNYVTLSPRRRRQWSDAQLNASSGEPNEYDLIGNYLHFDKPINHNATLEVQYQLGPSYFDGDSDTTKTPGFVAQFHQIIPLEIALEYCEINDMDSRAGKIRNRLGEAPTEGNLGKGLYKALVDYYATRNVDNRPAMTIQREDYGQTALAD